MKTLKITTKPNENSKLFKDVYVDNKCIGAVMANDKMSGIDCYNALKLNWEIDRLERQNDLLINDNLNY